MKRYTVMHTEWSDGWGGQEIRILTECLGMAGRGHRVSLCGCPEGTLRQKAEAAGLAFHPLAMAGPWDLRALAGLMGLVRREGVEIIHTHSSVDSWLGGFAARLTGRAAVRCRHLSVKVNTNPLNFVYRLPRAVVTTGEGIRHHLMEDYGLPADRVFSIPTGVDTGRYVPAEPDPALWEEFGFPPGAPVVAIVAVLRSWKRHDVFCRMAAEIKRRRPEVRFLIVGDGPGRERVKGYLRDMDLAPAMVMTGHREDVERILPLCTVCVLASDKAEGVPQAVLQELACQRAVVASDTGDVAQVVIPGKTGLLVPPGEPGPLADAVESLLDDPELRERLGRQGREMVLARHSMEHMLDQTEAVYARILANIPGGPEGRVAV